MAHTAGTNLLGRRRRRRRSHLVATPPGAGEEQGSEPSPRAHTMPHLHSLARLLYL